MQEVNAVMTMKRTELEKLKGKKIDNALGRGAVPHRFAQGASALTTRREQRKLDQAQGLVPFAVKLDGELVKSLQALAQQREVSLNILVGDLLRQSLEKAGG